MTEIVNLNTDLTDGKEKVILYLEGLLRQAKKGEMDGVLCIISHHDNTVTYSWTGSQHRYPVVGCMEDAKMALMADD